MPATYPTMERLLRPVEPEARSRELTRAEMAQAFLEEQLAKITSRERARRLSMTAFGGADSGIPGGMGAVDFVPFLGSAKGLEEGGRDIRQGNYDLESGRYGDAARNYGAAVLGVLPGAAGAVKVAPGLARAIKAAPQDEALRLAQQRAALPPEQGGLGLPAVNTPEQRAEAMGAIDWLHGTERLDRLLEKKNLDPRRATSGPMPYGTNSPVLASSYATKKADTSRRASDEGDVQNYFQVSPKSLGQRGSIPISVERTWNLLPKEKKAEILEKAKRVGYENFDQVEGPLTLHPEGVNAIPASEDHWNFILNREAKGNPLAALRNMWVDSGNLYGQEEELAKIYKLVGYPYEISQSNAPWASAQGVMTGKVMMSNPLDTENIAQLKENVIPYLKDKFKKDRSRLESHGVDQWAKNSRYTPKQWVNELEKDLSNGDVSYVWTSIPDKVTGALKELGYNGIIDKSGKGGGVKNDVLIPFAPEQLRSRFAAFDPFRRDAATAAAFGVAAPDLLAKEKTEEPPKKKKKPEGALPTVTQ